MFTVYLLFPFLMMVLLLLLTVCFFQSLKAQQLPRSAYEQAVKEAKANLTRHKQHVEANFEGKLHSELDVEMVKYHKVQLSRMHGLEEKLDDEVVLKYFQIVITKLF